MNRQRAKELLPIIQAFAEGKPIQSRYIKGNELFTDNTNPSFSNNFEYRIKPESKYRSFIDNKECWNEMLKHQPFGWVKNKNVENDYYLIDGVFYSENLDCPVIAMTGEALNYEEMINDYLFADGTPFGIMED